MSQEAKNPIFRRRKGYPEIADRYDTLKIQLVLTTASNLLECGPDAIKTSVDDAYSTFERGGVMTHLRNITRPTMSPLLDVVSENEKDRAACGMATFG